MQIKYLFFSNRLVFCIWRDNDIPYFVELSSDPEVLNFFPEAFGLGFDSLFTPALDIGWRLART